MHVFDCLLEQELQAQGVDGKGPDLLRRARSQANQVVGMESAALQRVC